MSKHTLVQQVLCVKVSKTKSCKVFFQLIDCLLRMIVKVIFIICVTMTCQIMSVTVFWN